MGLIVEITEDEIVEDYDRLLALLDPLLRRGLALAVDDLGAGHATTRHVTARVLVVDELGRLVHHVTIQGLLERRVDGAAAARQAA